MGSALAGEEGEEVILAVVAPEAAEAEGGVAAVQEGEGLTLQMPGESAAATGSGQTVRAHRAR